MVGVGITNRYHPGDLGGTSGLQAFTNHYLRGQGQHIDSHIVASRGHQGAGWARVIRVDNVESRTEHSMWAGTVVGVVGEQKEKSSGAPGIATIFSIGKFGRAMVKNHQVDDKIPGVLKKRTASQKGAHTQIWPITTSMYYYEIIASKADDTIMHREYAAFVTESDADQLRAILESTYDVVGVIRISKKQYMASVSEI